MKSPLERLDNVEWVMRYLVLHGANQITVELENKQVTRIRYRYPDGRPRQLTYSDHPLLNFQTGDFVITRGKS